MKNKTGIRGMYDPYTNKIINCKRNGLIYWHEKGHQDWFKKGFETETQTYAILLFFGGITVIAFNTTPNSLMFIVPAWILLLLNEIHAWWYAFKHYETEENN